MRYEDYPCNLTLTELLTLIKETKCKALNRLISRVELSKDKVTESFLVSYHKLRDCNGNCLEKIPIFVDSQKVGHQIIIKQTWSIDDILNSLMNYYFTTFQQKKFYSQRDTERTVIYRLYQSHYARSLVPDKYPQSAYMLMLKHTIEEKKTQGEKSDEAQCPSIEKKPRRKMSKEEKAARITAKMREEYNERHKFVDPPKITTSKSIWAVKKK